MQINSNFDFLQTVPTTPNLSTQNEAQVLSAQMVFPFEYSNQAQNQTKIKTIWAAQNSKLFIMEYWAFAIYVAQIHMIFLMKKTAKIVSVQFEYFRALV